MIVWENIGLAASFLSICMFLSVGIFLFLHREQYIYKLSGFIAAVIVLGPVIWLIWKDWKASELLTKLFGLGLKGEGAVYYELQKLSDKYVSFQDLKLNDGGNIDFAVIGPTGIFIIEAKSHGGVIGFNGQQLIRNGYPLEKNFLGQAKAEAASLTDYIEKHAEHRYFVKPIVAFSRARVRFGMNPVDGVFVINAKWIGEVITKGERTVSDLAIKELEEKIRLLTKTY